MLAMHPIKEPDVLLLINDGRFEGEIEGYVMLDGPNYLGCALFKVDGDVTTVLDTQLEDFLHVDGVARACIAAGENRGATHFAVNKEHAPLAQWWQRYCNNFDDLAPVSHIFTLC